MLWCPGWLHSLFPFQRGHFPRWIYLYVLCILQRACIQRKMLELFIWLCWKSLSSEKEAHGVCRWELKTSRPGRKPGSRSTEQVGQGWAEGPARVALPSPARREIARGRCDWSGRPQRAPVCPPGLQSPQSSSQVHPKLLDHPVSKEKTWASKQRHWHGSGTTSQVKPWLTFLLLFFWGQNVCVGQKNRQNPGTVEGKHLLHARPPP